MGSFIIPLGIYVRFVQANSIGILGQIISRGEFFLFFFMLLGLFGLLRAPSIKMKRE